MLDRTTAFLCSANGVSCGRCWSSTGRKDGPPDSYLEPLNPHGSPFFFGFQKPFLFPAGKKKWVLSSSQSPHRSKRPGGHFSLRSLARPLPMRPAALGSRGGPIVAVLPSSPWKGEGFTEVRSVRSRACLLTTPWPAGPGGRSSGAAGGRCAPSGPPSPRRPPG